MQKSRQAGEIKVQVTEVEKTGKGQNQEIRQKRQTYPARGRQGIQGPEFSGEERGLLRWETWKVLWMSIDWGRLR